MNIYILLISTLVLLILSGNSFFITFKKYEEDDEFIGGTSSFDFFELIIVGLEYISKKILPDKYHKMITKIFSFIFALFLLGFTILLWLLFTPIN